MLNDSIPCIDVLVREVVNKPMLPTTPAETRASLLLYRLLSHAAKTARVYEVYIFIIGYWCFFFGLIGHIQL